MIAKVLMVFSAGIILTLGITHLVYTFWGSKFTPRDPALQVRMSRIVHSPLLFQSPFLLIVGLAMLGGLFALARVCWFGVPFTGIGISLACYVASIAASRASPS